MHIAVVEVHVITEFIEAFKQATEINAENSRKEAGVVRFDFFQQVEDPCAFLLVEVYKSPEDQEKHRKTAHYLSWREAVAGMMAKPRIGTKYRNVSPKDEAW